MVLYQRKEGGQISVQLDAYKIKKNSLTLPYLIIPKRLGYFINVASSVYQQGMFKLKTNGEDPSLMNAFKNAKFQAAG